MYILHSQFILSLGAVSFGKAADNTQGTLIFPPVTRLRWPAVAGHHGKWKI